MLKVEIKTNDDVQIVKLSGELTIDTVLLFEGKFDELVAKKIILDLDDLSYIGSTGLRSLVLLIKKIYALHGKIAVANMKGMVKEVIEVSGFSSIIEIRETLEEALEIF